MLIAQGSFEIPDYVMDIVTQLKVIHLPQFNQLLPARWGVGTAFMVETNVLTHKRWCCKKVRTAAVAQLMGGSSSSHHDSTIAVMCLQLMVRSYYIAGMYHNSTSKLPACGGLSASAACLQVQFLMLKTNYKGWMKQINV